MTNPDEEITGTLALFTEEDEARRTGSNSTMEQAFTEVDAAIAGLIKEANRYLSALKSLQTENSAGNVVGIAKAAEQAGRLRDELQHPAQVKIVEAPEAVAWLASDAWRREIGDALRAHGLAVIEDSSGALLCPPVALVAHPNKTAIMVGRSLVRTIRPDPLALKIKPLRDRDAGTKTPEFLDKLHEATLQIAGATDRRATFRRIYAQFCIAPGWKKDNSELEFGQQIYALRESGIQTTKDGTRYQIQEPSGKVKRSDIFIVYGADGREHEFYAIRFF